MPFSPEMGGSSPLVNHQRRYMDPVVRTAPAFGEGTVGVAITGAGVAEFQCFRVVGLSCGLAVLRSCSMVFL